VAPSILRDRVRRGMIVPQDQVAPALQSTFAADLLRAERERAFRIVAEHGERRLAAYSGEAGQAGTGPADAGELAGPDRQPSILACAAPWPGMEPLIRRSAALAAQVDGLLRVAVVRLGWPEEDALMASYAAMTEQLGGEFVRLSGPSPAAALAQYARERQVTELVLSRTLPAGRYPVLRELVRLVHDAELHLLPAEPG
jgi:two-component system, OmpR family, sensor histidine kinase KdpD